MAKQLEWCSEAAFYTLGPRPTAEAAGQDTVPKSLRPATTTSPAASARGCSAGGEPHGPPLRDALLRHAHGTPIHLDTLCRGRLRRLIFETAALQPIDVSTLLRRSVMLSAWPRTISFRRGESSRELRLRVHCPAVRPLQTALRPPQRLHCSVPYFAAGKMFIPDGSRAAKPGNPVTRRLAAMNGFQVSVRNRESNAPIVPIAAFFRSPIK